MRKRLNVGLLGNFLWGLLAAERVSADSRWISIRGVYSKAGLRVPRERVRTVTVEPQGWGSAKLRFLGDGVELASVTLPARYCEKIQAWLLEEVIGKN